MLVCTPELTHSNELSSARYFLVLLLKNGKSYLISMWIIHPSPIIISFSFTSREQLLSWLSFCLALGPIIGKRWMPTKKERWQRGQERGLVPKSSPCYKLCFNLLSLWWELFSREIMGRREEFSSGKSFKEQVPSYISALNVMWQEIILDIVARFWGPTYFKQLIY